MTMKGFNLPAPDKKGIIRALPDELSEVNKNRLKKFGVFMFLYDFAQDHMVRPRIHKADPERHRDILKAHIAPIRNAQVLDMACGTGGAIPHFDPTNAYTGLDLSYAMLRQAVKKAKKKGFPTCRLIEGNAEDLPFEKASFDLVLMDTALHMIPRYDTAISEAGRVLKKDGTFFCATPAVGIHRAFDSNWEKIAGKRELHSLTEQDISDVCTKHALSYSRAETNGGVLYFTAKNALRPE